MNNQEKIIKYKKKYQSLQNKIPRKAIAVFQKSITGYVNFIEVDNDLVEIEVNISGLTPGKHGFHIHERGNLLENCKKCKGHYNPFNKNHGGRLDEERHVGDLGNIIVDQKGNAYSKFIDKLVKLRGDYSVIGRSVVIHSGEDDINDYPTFVKICGLIKK